MRRELRGTSRTNDGRDLPHRAAAVKHMQAYTHGAKSHGEVDDKLCISASPCQRQRMD